MLWGWLAFRFGHGNSCSHLVTSSHAFIAKGVDLLAGQMRAAQSCSVDSEQVRTEQLMCGTSSRGKREYTEMPFFLISQDFLILQISCGATLCSSDKSFPDFKQEAHWDCTGEFLKQFLLRS